MALEDYAKRYNLDYVSPLEQKERREEEKKRLEAEEWQRLHTPPTYNMYGDKASLLNQAVSQYEQRKKAASVPVATSDITPRQTSIPDFRQLEGEHSDWLKKKADEFAKNNRNMLNPYIPEEAYELQKRGVNVSRSYNVPDNPMIDYQPNTLSRIEGSKAWRTLIGTPEEGYGIGDMLNATLMANPAGVARTGAGRVLTTATSKATKPITNLWQVVKTKTPVPVKKGLGIGTAATGYETIKGATDPEYVDRRETFPSEFGAGLRVGTGDLLTTAGSAARWQGKDNLADALTQKGEDIQAGFDDLERVEYEGWQSWFNPDFYTANVARTLPMTAALVPAMLVSYKAAGGAATKRGFGEFGKVVIASLAGSLASRPLEAALEAGDTYDQTVQAAKAQNPNITDEQAHAIGALKADEVYNKNLKLTGMDAAQLAVTFMPIKGLSKTGIGKAGGIAGKLAFDMETEALEEGLQQAWQSQALGEDERNVWSQMFINPTPEMLESKATGRFLGGVLGGAGVVNDLIKDRTIQKMPPEAESKFTQAVNKYVKDGMTREKAIHRALDEWAATPEGKVIVSQTAQEVAAELEEETKRQMADVGTVAQTEENITPDNTVIPDATASDTVIPGATPPDTAIPGTTPALYSIRTGEPLKLIDDSNPEFVVVKNSQGENQMVSRDEVTNVAPEGTQPISENEPPISLEPASDSEPILSDEEIAALLAGGAEAPAGIQGETAPVQPEVTQVVKDSIRDVLEGRIPTAPAITGQGVPQGPFAPLQAKQEPAGEEIKLPEGETIPGGDIAPPTSGQKAPGESVPIPQEPVNVGDTVYSKRTGKPMEVVSIVGNTGNLRVKNSQGNVAPIKIDEVMREKPEAKAVSKPVEEKPADPITGNTTTAKTERGTNVEVQYAVVDGNDLIASHTTGFAENKDYPRELQPRDRERAASKVQITRMAGNIEPEFLGESPKASDGAPIVGPDMVVESGNGRIIALKLAYDNNKNDSSQRYRAWLLENAEKFGLTKKQIDKIDKPVLVRVRTTDIDRVQFAKEANEQSVSAMSATEQAMSDAQKLGVELLMRFSPGENGEILTISNHGFIQDFMADVVGPTEQARYVTSDGSISQEGVNRIRNAVFAKAYGDASIVEKLAESTDNNVKNITNAMVMAAPKMVQLKAAIDADNLFDFNITPEIAEAAKRMSQLRESGKTLAEFLLEQNNSLFGSDLTPMVKDILEIFNRNKRSAKRIADILNSYVDGVVMLGDPKQQNLFGESPDLPTKAELLNSAVSTIERGAAHGAQSSLFADKTGDGRKDNEVGKRNSQGGTRQETTRGNETEGEETGEVGKTARFKARKQAGVKFKRGEALQEQSQSSYQRAIRKFGTTNDFREAGYATPNGKLLDFSGKRQGGPSGERTMDHREISDIYEETFENYSDGMCKFMDEGNIRLQSDGFELTQLPTKQQEVLLSQFIGNNNGEVYVDLGKIGKHNTMPLGVEYTKGTKATKILADIRRYYTVGEEPQISGVSQFRFKRNLTPEQEKDLEVLKVVAEQRKLGPFTINKAELAPEAMERPEFQAAGEIAEKLGLRLVTFRNKGGHRGAYYDGTLYINEGIKDPVDYVFFHEVTHSMQNFQPQHYERLLDLSLEHLADTEGIDKHYIRQGYERADRPHEFAADVFAEAMSTPGFFARVAERAPELIKPLLEAIDRLIANVRGMISKDDTIIPYMRDWEVLRQRIRDEVAMPYFKDAMGEKQFTETFGKQLKEPAAKAKAETVPEVAGNPDIRLKARRTTGETKFNLQDPDIQSRMESACGVPKEGMREKISELWEEVKRKTREYEWLPRTARFAEIRRALLNLSKQKGVAADKTLRILDDITKPLNEYEYSLFTYKVIFDDLAHEAEEGHMLPFGFTPESLEVERAEVDRAVENIPKVKEAVEKRHKAWAEIKNDYTKACDAIGFHVEDRLRKENYYRHQVLEHANAKGVAGAGKKLRTPTNRGFLRKREGSTFDINTDYLQAEYEVMAQMHYDAEIAKVIKVVKQYYDIVNKLKRDATKLNDQAMYDYFDSMIEQYELEDVDAGKLYRKLLNTKQAIAISRLEELAAKGELPIDPAGRFEPLVQELANSHFAKKAGDEGVDVALDAEMPKDKFHREFFAYLNWLVNGEEGQAKITALTVFKGMAEKQRQIKNTLGKDYLTWEDLIPEGYSTWQPREGNIFFMVDSIPERIAEALYSGILEEAGVTGDMLKRVMTVGQKFPEMVIPDEVALTLDELHKDAKQEGAVAKYYHTAIRGWKQWQLIFLKRYFKYNARNLTGDLDAVIAGNPKALKKVPKAWNDLWAAFFTKDKKMSPELEGWFTRGGFESLFQAQEISDVNRNRQFKHLMESKMRRTKIETLANAPKDAWLKYWDFARTTTDFREALLRYACYLDYLEQMEGEKTGRPNNFGASNRDEIMALHDTKDRAFKLTNELLGAYDEVSVTGQWLATNLIPFWRWNEVNFVRYVRLFKNAYQDGKLTETVGRKVATVPIRSAKIAMQVGKMWLKASLLMGIITAWNLLFFGDEEDDLPEDVRARFHITFGRDKQGNVIYFSRLGALQDFLDWFGVDVAPQHIQNLLSGRRTMKEVAIDMVKSPVNKGLGSFGPQISLPVGLIGKQNLFPEPLKPRHIYNRTEFLFESFGLKDEYRELTGKPTRGYGQTLTNLFVYKSDPGQTAYYANKDEIVRFKKKIGKGGGEGYFEKDAKGEALHNFKLAIRYRDETAASRYLTEYVMLGGTQKGLNQSLRTMHPLYGLTEDEKTGFLAQLDSAGRENFLKAMEYYNGVIMP